jgi:hypothetical protein
MKKLKPTTETIEEFIGYISTGILLKKACIFVGFSYPTLMRHMSEDQRSRYDAIQEQLKPAIIAKRKEAFKRRNNA